MTTADAWNYAAPGSTYRPNNGWGGRVSYAPSDFVTLLLREFWLMAIVFVVIVAAGVAFALTLKTSYTAYSSLSIRIGQEYVYQPRTGDAGRGAIPTIDDVVQTEMNILLSRPVAERALQEIGLDKVYPKLAAAPDKQAGMEKALETIGKSFEAEAAPETSILKVSFKHDDRMMAARMLNALLDAYLVRRSELLRPNTPAIEAQKAITEAKLSDADAAYGNFLTFNNIGDFEAERDSLKQAQNTLEQQRLATAASLKDRQSRLASLTGRLAAVQPEQVVSRDINLQSQAALNDLQAQRIKLLNTYQPGSQAVKDIDQKIADTQAAIAARPITGDTARRLGPNPVYQTLQTDQINLTAEVSGLTSQLASLDGQIKTNTERQLRMAQLEPQFQILARDRGILQDSAKEFAQRQQESLAAQGIADKGSDNIRIVARASPPLEGSSLKKPVAVLVLLLAGFTALCIGLLRVFLKPGAMTPATAGRSLDLPVLGSARARR